MEVTVERPVEWDDELYLREEPHGNNGVFLKREQITFLLDETHFPEGKSIRLPQPDASYSHVTVIRFATSWHFCQGARRELIIQAVDWPTVREKMISLRS